MVILEQYFGSHAHTAEHVANAEILLKRVNALIQAYIASGGKPAKNPRTESIISGVTFGGFRPQDCPQGAKDSPHKVAMGIDIFDPENALDRWINDATLIKFDLYREHPDYTKGWCHLQTRPVKSGRRSYIPA